MANLHLLQKGDLKKSDFTNDNSNNKEGIGIRVSKQGGNLLEKRNDGIYYGIQAPPDLANLYISNSGNDSNVGSRAEPLKTLEEALRRIPNSPQTFHIHLHEGHTFELHNYFPRYLATINLVPYGPQTDTTHPASGFGNIYYRGYLAADLNRPIINVFTHVTPNGVGRPCLVTHSTTLRGLHLRIHGNPLEVDDGSKPGVIRPITDTIGRGLIYISGTILEIVSIANTLDAANGGYRHDVYFRGDMDMLHSKVIPSDLSTMKDSKGRFSQLISSAYTNSVVVQDFAASTMRTGDGTKNGEVLATADEVRGYFSIGKNVHTKYDAENNAIFGLGFNWDALATSGLR